MDWLLPVLVILIVLVLVLLVWLVSARTTGRNIIFHQLEALKNSQDGVRDALNKSLQSGQESINRNLHSSQQILSRLNSQIGELQGTNKQMLYMQTDIKRLQNILSSPKLRGGMGEWSLKNILENVMPADSYRLQHPFRDGKIVDALVNLIDYSVPVDAKFPLPSFEKIAKAESDDQKAKMRKQFIRDVTSHIDKIASSYIRPSEGTLDFALMYIPAENVYYETIVKYAGDNRDLMQHALDKKVIPVSPAMLHAYLMTVVMGLHGLKIEKQAAEIQQNLKKLNADFAEFLQNWDTLGTHIRNTAGKYDEAGKKLDRFGLQLDRIQSDTEQPQDDTSKNLK